MAASTHRPEGRHRGVRYVAIASDPVCRLWDGSLQHIKAFLLDLVDGKMLPVKLLFFFELAGIVTIWPHVATHMAHLRLTPDEIGLIAMTGGLAGVVASLSAGYIGDRMGNFKVYLALTLLLEGGTGVAMAFVPPAVTEVVPAGAVPLRHGCADGLLHVQWLQEDCAPHQPLLTALNLTLRDCVVVCDRGDAARRLGALACPAGDPHRCAVLFSESDTPQPLSVQLSNSSNTSSAVHVLGPGGRQLPRPVACPLQLPAASCQLRCRDQVSRALVCAGQQDRSRHTLSLWLYMALRVLYSFCLGTTFLLIDSAVLAYCAEYTGLDYGFQRLWGALAALVVSPLAGFVMDVLSTDGVTNFRPGFYMVGGFRVLSLAALYFVNISFRNNPPKSLLRCTWRMLRTAELSILFLTLLLIGMVVGHIETFSYLFLDKLGADRTLIGATITVGSAVELLVLAVSGFFLRHCGHVNLITIGMVLYVIRLIGFFFIVSPVYSLLFETLDGINGGLMHTAAITYAASKVAPELVATVRGILGCVLSGGGRALGAQLGGYTVRRLGHRYSFLVFAGVAALAAAIYLLFHTLRRHQRSRAFTVSREDASGDGPLSVSPESSSVGGA